MKTDWGLIAAIIWSTIGVLYVMSLFGMMEWRYEVQYPLVLLTLLATIWINWASSNKAYVNKDENIQ